MLDVDGDLQKHTYLIEAKMHNMVPRIIIAFDFCSAGFFFSQTLGLV
jgi:hypothetical protein